MLANRAFFRSRSPFEYEPAIPALPLHGGSLFKDFSFLDVFYEGQVSGLVEFFHLGYLAERLGSFREIFLFGHLGETLIEGGPFKIFPGRRGFQIGSCIPDLPRRVTRLNLRLSTLEQIEEELGMLFLVVGCLQKDSCNLLVACLAGRAGKIGIPIPCLRFTGKSCQ